MTVKIKVNKDLGLFKAGDVVRLVKIDQYWRRRLKDAETDNCCELVNDKPKRRSSTKSEGKD